LCRAVHVAPSQWLFGNALVAIKIQSIFSIKANAAAMDEKIIG
jgi:hypothetical protein